MVVLVVLASSAAARAAEVGGLVAGVTAEGRAQDDTLFGGGQDLVGVVSPEIGYRFDGQRLDLSLRYDADLYDYQGALPRYDTNQRGYLRLDAKPSRETRVLASGSVQWITDPLALDRLGLPRVTSPVLFGEAAIEGDERIAERWTLRAGEESQIVHFEDPALVDGSVHQPWIEGARAISAHDELALRVRGQFFFRVDTPAGLAQTASIGWRHRIGERLRVDLAAGPILYEAPGAAVAPTPYATGGLIWTIPHGELELRGGRDLLGATGFGTALWADYVEAGWIARLSRRWSGRLGGTYFVDGLAPNAPASLTGYAAEGAIDFLAGRDWKIEAVVDWIGQTDVPGAGPFALGLEVVAMRVSWQWGSDRRLIH